MNEPTFTLTDLVRACDHLITEGMDAFTVRIVRDELTRVLCPSVTVAAAPPCPSTPLSAPAPTSNRVVKHGKRPQVVAAVQQSSLFTVDDIAATVPPIPADGGELDLFIRRRLGEFNPSPYQMAIFCKIQ